VCVCFGFEKSLPVRSVHVLYIYVCTYMYVHICMYRVHQQDSAAIHLHLECFPHVTMALHEQLLQMSIILSQFLPVIVVSAAHSYQLWTRSVYVLCFVHWKILTNVISF